MDVMHIALCVYGPGHVLLGTMDSEGVVWSNQVVIFRIKQGLVYSMHECYLGKLVDGACRKNRGELIFTLRDL